MTPLKHGDGEIFQKGVDVMIATDLISLAYNDAYDIAVILGGDTDLIESIRFVRKNLKKKIIVVAFYTKGEPLLSNVSDLRAEADLFLNLNEDFTDEEIINMSDLLRN